MGIERFPADDPREWMNRARSNLIRARTRIPETYLEDLCFDAQQAAEKALKAVLIAREFAFPYTHDLAKLIKLLEATGETIPEKVRDADQLTVFAVMTRYPPFDEGESVTDDDYVAAVAIAEAVVAWAAVRIRPDAPAPR